MAETVDPINDWLIDEMRDDWARSPESVDPSWRDLFDNEREQWGAGSRPHFRFGDLIDVASTIVDVASRRAPAVERAPCGSVELDVQFVLDTTDLTGEDIARLSGHMSLIGEQIAGLPSGPDVRFGATVYHTEGGRFVARTIDFDADLRAVLAAVADAASGTGEHPAIVHDALDFALETSSWRGGRAVELLILGADAPTGRLRRAAGPCAGFSRRGPTGGEGASGCG